MQPSVFADGALAAKKAKLTTEARADLNRVGSKSSLEQEWRVNLRGDCSLVGTRRADWFTGKPPSACPGLRPDGTLSSLALPVRIVTLPWRARGALRRADARGAGDQTSMALRLTAALRVRRTCAHPAASRCWHTLTTRGR